VEFGGEPDHVHLLTGIHPALDISVPINNLKTASTRRARNRFAHRLAPFLPQPLFWHRAYFVASVGGAPLETVPYIEAQGTTRTGTPERSKSKGKNQTVRLTPPVRSASPKVCCATAPD
jgi:putative transposase